MRQFNNSSKTSLTRSWKCSFLQPHRKHHRNKMWIPDQVPSCKTVQDGGDRAGPTGARFSSWNIFRVELHHWSVLLSPQRSWKTQYFVLFKISEMEHQLKYFRTPGQMERPVGGIDLSQCVPTNRLSLEMFNSCFLLDTANPLFDLFWCYTSFVSELTSSLVPHQDLPAGREPPAEPETGLDPENLQVLCVLCALPPGLGQGLLPDWGNQVCPPTVFIYFFTSDIKASLHFIASPASGICFTAPCCSNNL